VAKNTGSLKHGVAVSALFSAISLLYGASAQASFVPGHIDPGGTGTVPAFTGDVVFNIPSACFATDGINFTNSISGCGNATVYSAVIDLYTTDPAAPPAPPNSSPIGQFTLTPIDSWPISEIFVINGGLAGVETGIMGPDPGTDSWSGRNFWLDFDCDLCNQVQFAASSDSSILGITSGSAFIYINVPEFPNQMGDKSLPGTITFGGFCDDPNNCFVQQTPEPATLGLIAGALGGAWIAGRRKKMKPTA
jgi:PEP-CTERM motif